MTDKEIIKALECCNHIEIDCELCPFYTTQECSKVMIDNALALINRQQAQIERLETLNERLGNDIDLKLKYIYELEEKLKTAKAEAVKEFAERLKKEIDIRPTHSREQNKYVFFLIDNLLKEMVGEG